MDTNTFSRQEWYVNKGQFTGDTILADKMVCNNMVFQLEMHPVDHDVSKPLQFNLRLTGTVYGLQNIICNVHFNYPNKIKPFMDVPLCYSFITTDNVCIVKSKVTLLTLERGGWFNKDVLHMTVTVTPTPEMPKMIEQVKTPPKLNEIIKAILRSHPLSGPSLLDKSDINWLCAAASSLMLKQPTLLRLKAPIVVVGDIHGRYFDLLRIFKKYGFPDKTNYLFLGDYVDRGEDSLDVITLLLALKLRFPENIFLLRGNHECESINSLYGFKDECKQKGAPYKPFVLVFDSMPLAAVINDKVFCVHGGISPAITSLDDITSFKRPMDLPREGIINDLTWADPSYTINYYGKSHRQTSVTYGKSAAESFMNMFGFEMILRAHEAVPNGFYFPFGDDVNVLTIFSAPQYNQDNFAATLIFDKDLKYSIDSYVTLTNAEVEELLSTDFTDAIQL